MQHPSSLRGFAVLVVEDNPNVLEATSYLIEAGHDHHLRSRAAAFPPPAIDSLGHQRFAAREGRN